MNNMLRNCIQVILKLKLKYQEQIGAGSTNVVCFGCNSVVTLLKCCFYGLLIFNSSFFFQTVNYKILIDHAQSSLYMIYR